MLGRVNADSVAPGTLEYFSPDFLTLYIIQEGADRNTTSFKI
jgi:hypothetical protein